MKTLQKITNLKVILSLLGVYLFFILYLMQLPYLRTESAMLESLDIRWSYSMDDVSTLFNLLGTEGLESYKIFILVDFAYILVYSTLLSLSFIYLHNRMVRLGKLTAWMPWLPLLLALLDITENINTWQLINSFPTLSEFAVNLGSIITCYKWFVASLCAGWLLFTIMAVFLKYVLQKWRYQNNT